MNRILLAILTILTCLPIFAASGIKGEIKLEYARNAFGSEKVFKKEFGETVKAKTEWYVGDFFGKEVLFAGVRVINTGKTPKAYYYYVAFFNAEKELIGAVGQTSSVTDAGLEPGMETQLASCLITLPKGKYKEIKYYEAILYEEDAAAK